MRGVLKLCNYIYSMKISYPLGVVIMGDNSCISYISDHASCSAPPFRCGLLMLEAQMTVNRSKDGLQLLFFSLGDLVARGAQGVGYYHGTRTSLSPRARLTRLKRERTVVVVRVQCT